MAADHEFVGESRNLPDEIAWLARVMGEESDTGPDGSRVVRFLRSHPGSKRDTLT